MPKGMSVVPPDSSTLLEATKVIFPPCPVLWAEADSCAPLVGKLKER
jgi:hypothetical protein